MDSRAAHSSDEAGAGVLTGAPAGRLFRGDNLPVLTELAATMAGRFRCVYLDPPFNTGRTFASYVDRRAPSEWARFMAERLAALYPLVADDGALVAEIDDTELATLQTLLDDVFGRAQRISTITLVRSAATGHKAQNLGPVNVTDYLLVYAKDRKKLRTERLLRPRRGFDRAYRLFVTNRDDAPTEWVFEALPAAAARHFGFASARAASRELGAELFEARLQAFALEHAESVARLAQPRFEAVSRAAQALIERSRADKGRVFVLEREARPPLWLKGGNRILFLARKVAEVDGARCIVEPLTNVWDDVPFQGIAKEGGVTFVRNKKPERLIERVLQLVTKPGDWVLDPFLGSGTTAAVAHKMGRRYVGVEESPKAFALAVERLRAVVDGRDARGVTRSTGFRGGGAFAVHD